MTSLKELTNHNHVLAEEHSFVKMLLSGKITSGIYATFLANQLLQYQTLEHCAEHLLSEIPGLARSELILQDLLDLDEPVIFFDTTAEYCDHVKQLDDAGLWAHIYTKHMGDLYGGQILKKVVPGSGLMYQFNDRKLMIEKLRTKLFIEMAPEANYAFESAIKLFDRIADEYNL
jgi:heme oxygenase